MRIFSSLIVRMVNWAARNGFATRSAPSDEDHRRQARHLTGVRGETFAYWYLRRHGYVMVCRNFRAPGVKGEIDLIGFDGPTLAFVEVKTRNSKMEESGLSEDAFTPLPEDAVTMDKRRFLARMARQFLVDRRLNDVNWRYDVLAIESRSGRRPVVRLHKGAFTDR